MNLRRYKITYVSGFNGEADPTCPRFETFKRAHSPEHAREMFQDPDDSDWIVLKVERVKG